MPEAILVLVRDPEETHLLLGAAARLADIMGHARINALAIRETIRIIPRPAATLADRADALVAAREEEQRRVLALRAAFDDWKATAGRQAWGVRWLDMEGCTTDIVARRGRRADVIVVGRPAQEDRPGRQALEVALLGTDRPILMVPPKLAATPAAFGRCIAIAWREESRSLRAVLPALRWFAGAEQVHVLIRARDMAKRLDIHSVFSDHGLAPYLHGLAMDRGPYGQTLLDAAHRLSADLLVTDAYEQNPVRELVLGGVTRHLLTHADLPVLMRH